MSSISRAEPAPRNNPSGPMNFNAFHSAGLWLAVIARPPCAPLRRTIICTVGTGHIPMSTTRQPLDSSPAMTACLTISPDVRGSRPMTIPPDPTYVPKACANRVSNVGDSESPMTPRTPAILILRVGMARVGLGTWYFELSTLSFELSALYLVLCPLGRFHFWMIVNRTYRPYRS